MEYLLAIALPPISVAINRGVWLAILATILLFPFWFPGSILALAILIDKKSKENNERVVSAILEASGKGPAKSTPTRKVDGVRPLYVEPIDEQPAQETYDPADDWIDSLKRRP